MQRLLVVFAVLLLAWRAGGAERVFDFSDTAVNETPKGFRSALSGTGKPGDWKVIMDEGSALLSPISPKAPRTNKRAVLAQLSRERTDEHSPLLIFEEETYGDFTLTTRFKIVDGQAEQMAGIAFRIQDEKNYYYIRASALGNSFYFFKIVDGVRSAPIGTKAPISKGAWHELTIECKGHEIRGLLDGKELIPTLGDKTFKSGKLGFWTKSDSVSYFSDTRLVYTPKEILAQVIIRDTMRTLPRLKGLKIYAATTNAPVPRVIASSDVNEIGLPAETAERDVMARGVIYQGKESDTVTVTMPLHDRNGETVGAVAVRMKSFPGQTEKNAIVRALPIVKQMEARVQSARDLVE